MDNVVPAGSVVHDELRPIVDIHDGQAHIADNALVGGRCDGCRAVAFPFRDVCMACGSRGLATIALPTTGTLYSFTTVYVASSRPTPYTIGYVDLDGGTRLLAGIEGAVDQLACGIRMRLQVHGDAWSFAPEDRT